MDNPYCSCKLMVSHVSHVGAFTERERDAPPFVTLAIVFSFSLSLSLSLPTTQVQKGMQTDTRTELYGLDRGASNDFMHDMVQRLHGMLTMTAASNTFVGWL